MVRLHPTRQLQLIALAVFAVPMTAVSSAAADKALTPQQVEFFEKRVRPLLISRCFQCHSGKSKVLKGGLRLDSHQAVLKGGDTGTAVVPGEPDKSLLVRSIRYQAYEMPPTGKLKPAEIAVLVEWVRRGAFWPAEKSTTIARTANGRGLTRRNRPSCAVTTLCSIVTAVVDCGRLTRYAVFPDVPR